MSFEFLIYNSERACYYYYHRIVVIIIIVLLHSCLREREKKTKQNAPKILEI